MAGEKLLIVDDEEMNRDMLSRRLKREGFEVVLASSGMEALECIANTDIDLVLLDIMMPEMSGFEVLSRMRSDHTASRLPVIMVSAAGDSSQIVQALDEGANDYVTKPVNLPILLARVHSQLARSREAAPFKVTVGAKVSSYRVDSLLGKGGMATVYQATDTRLNRIVALKVMNSEQQSSDDMTERFLREAKAIAQINHPGVVSVYEAGTKPCYFIAMELVEGQELNTFIDYKALPLKLAVDLSLQLADILSEIHSHKILHRDLKPTNLKVDSNNKLHLMDFGLVKMLGADTNLTKTGIMLGTPQYMAPEQIESELGHVSLQTDLYQFGLIMHEMLTGRPALKGVNVHALMYEIINREPQKPSELNPLVPPSLDEVCIKLQKTSPADRYQSAGEVKEILEKIKETLE